MQPRTFDGDVQFLKKHTDVLVLGEPGQAQVAVAPKWQGRVMTSTVGGPGGLGCGWINDEHVASEKLTPHMNAFGGEDRLWLGPEGGQFSIYFKKDSPFDFEHWQTPACIDTDGYEIVAQDPHSASFRHKACLENYSGTKLDFQLDRTVRLLSPADAAAKLGVAVPQSIHSVVYESENRITNTGPQPWTREGGMLSIWILSMYKPAPHVTVAIPYQAGDEKSRGAVVNDAYFGKVPADRLRVTPEAVFFRCDGKYRSKIGFSPKRAKPVAGSYDADARRLTIVQFNQPQGATEYVNSMWEIQKNPFDGDAVNSYNDGPPAPGKKPMGPFYELETSSPAAALQPGQALTHFHRTFHFEGDEAELDKIAKAVLGVGIEQIKTAFTK
ncbi:MAG: hypothetical protein HZB38_09610 [Planctomycetes bacterium]|nr:hypothetical protein [Planctomycetota bacterium]